MTGAVIIAALTFAGVLVGTVIYIVKVIRSLHVEVRNGDVALLNTTKAWHDVTIHKNDLERNLRDMRAALDDKVAEVERERDARKRAERHRDTLITEIAKNGAPATVVEAINAELESLAAMSGRPR